MLCSCRLSAATARQFSSHPLRNFSSSGFLASKASKSRTAKGRPARPLSKPPIQAGVTPTISTKNSLLEEDDAESAPLAQAVTEIPPAASRIYPETEEVYHAIPAVNPALFICVGFVMSVFCLSAADVAWRGFASLEEEKTAEKKPQWQRALFAGAFLVVGSCAVIGGTLTPSRLVTKVVLRRPPNSTTRFPAESRVEIHNALTKLLFFGKRTVPLSRVTLLGPLLRTTEAWHPREYKVPPASGILSSLFAGRSARKTTQDRSHVPLIIKGDLVSYSMAREPRWIQTEEDRLKKGGAKSGDWVGLEKALLGVHGEAQSLR